jgi:signal recognition particle receptor subunit beta
MNTVLVDFNTRIQEINDYFVFLESLIQDKTKLAVFDLSGEYKLKSIDSELSKTLKANCFLLLYNLVESTMRNAIEAIFDELDDKKVCFDSIKSSIQITILQNMQNCFKNSSAKKIHSKISNLSLDIIKATFEREKIFSGNVDAKVIKETSEKYGFSCNTECSKTKNGYNLLVVKNNRNDLAHGIKSFEEVGRDKTIEEIIEIKNEVFEYLRQILNNIQEYLDDREYLDL